MYKANAASRGYEQRAAEPRSNAPKPGSVGKPGDHVWQWFDKGYAENVYGQPVAQNHSNGPSQEVVVSRLQRAQIMHCKSERRAPPGLPEGLKPV